MSEAAAATPAPSAPLTQAGSSPVIQAPETGSTAPEQGSSSPGQKKPAAAPQAPAKPEVFDVKVDGQIIKMTREELIQNASLGHVSDKRFQEAAKLRKQTEAALGRIRDPKQLMATLTDPALGYSKEQIREVMEDWYAKEFIEPDQLTPEQKKLREYEAKINKYDEEEKSREQQKLVAQQEAMTEQARQGLQQEIIEVLDTGALPKTNFSIRRLAFWMQRNQANGFNAPKEVLVAQVRKEFNENLRDMVQASDGEVLMKLFEGTDIVNKIRKYDVESLRKLRGGGAQIQSETTPAQETRGERPLTSGDVTSRLRELQRTGQY